MIISDKHKFAFVHIPKCAGTSIRALLEQLDDTDGKYGPKVVDVAGYGKVDMTHLPLPMLAELAPDDLEKLKAYESFAIVRDPFERFFSALAQYSKMYQGTEIAQMSTGEVKKSALDVLNSLKTLENRYSHELVHFTPQVDFIFWKGNKIVKNIYPITATAPLVDDIEGLTRQPLGPVELQNPTRVFHSGKTKAIALTGKRIVETVFPRTLSDPLRRMARNKLMSPTSHRLQGYAKDPDIADFISCFYAEDQRIFDNALSRFPEL